MGRTKKPEPTEAIYAANSIATIDGKHVYPTDFVKEFFINSDKTVEEMAIQLNLPMDVVQFHARKGIQSWYKLKQEKLGERMRYFMDINIDNLTETHSLLEEGHFLAIIQMKDMQRFLKAYYEAKGHLFRIGEDGEISLDGYGLPIPLPLPNGPKDLMVLEVLLKLKEGTKQALNQVYAENLEAKKQEVVDVESLDIFEESSE